MVSEGPQDLQKYEKLIEKEKFINIFTFGEPLDL
jgi:hypothetical protein